MAVLATDRGKAAITRFSPVAHGLIAGCPVTLVHCALETGRTHQIRVHAEFIKHPLVGDRSYARGAPSRGVKVIDDWKDSVSKNLVGQALHAWCLKFTHPGLESEVYFKAGVTSTVRELFLLALKEDGYAVWEKLFTRAMV
jgi:23S rRNA pseudouridine1911/1915/1917 synthase